jgi:hypothetical protein
VLHAGSQLRPDAAGNADQDNLYFYPLVTMDITRKGPFNLLLRLYAHLNPKRSTESGRRRQLPASSKFPV